MLRIEQLTFAYRKAEKVSLEEIDLNVSKGEVVAIVGPTGAGKTTLCLTCNGLIPQTVRGRMRGKVTINGQDTKSTPIYELARDVGMVFENPEAQFLGDTVQEEVAFGLENLCIPLEEMQGRISSALEVVRMTKYDKRLPFHLSGGQKQRVAIACALAMEPELLVLDEPTSELDPIGKNEVLRTVRDLKEESGKSILLVTHETDEVVRIADRVILLRDGKVSRVGSPTEVFTAEVARESSIREPQLFHFWREVKGLEKDFPPLTEDEVAKSLSGKFKPVKPESIFVRPTGKPIIEVRDLWFKYPNGVEALRNINMEVYEGEFVAIVGQNGSGKTTLAKHFNGLHKPTRGVVEIEGKKTDPQTVAKLARTVGYTFQNPDHQLFEQTVKKEIEFGLKNIGVPEKEIVSRIKYGMSAVGLNIDHDQYPYFLGKGERQKLALASVIAMQPKILMIDEPTTGQDWESALDVMETLRDLNKKGHTVIFISHDMRLVAEFAQRVIVLSKGRLIEEGSPRSVLYNEDILEEAFLHPPPIVELAKRLSPKAASLGIIRVEELVDCIED